MNVEKNDRAFSRAATQVTYKAGLSVSVIFISIYFCLVRLKEDNLLQGRSCQGQPELYLCRQKTVYFTNPLKCPILFQIKGGSLAHPPSPLIWFCNDTSKGKILFFWLCFYQYLLLRRFRVLCWL